MKADIRRVDAIMAVAWRWSKEEVGRGDVEMAIWDAFHEIRRTLPNPATAKARRHNSLRPGRHDTGWRR